MAGTESEKPLRIHPAFKAQLVAFEALVRELAIEHYGRAPRRIVHLAAPFAAFPPDIAKDVDILHITRTWTFTTGDRFVSE